MDSENVLHLREARIEDIREHPPEVAAALARVLASGARVMPDPKRANFFEIQADSIVYYVHISPVSGKILLLGTWPIEPAPEMADQLA
jgi:hypothetical protein